MRADRFHLTSVVLVALLAACAAPGNNTVQPSAASLAKYSELSALDIVTAQEKSVSDAKADGMPFMSPRHFRDASLVLSESQNALSNKPKEQLAQLAAKSDAILDKGRAIMSIVQYRFAQELELKTRLDKLDTEKNLPKEYERVMADFSALIDKIEREQADNIDKKKDELTKDLQSLEVRAVQESALRVSETINADSKNKNAEKQIPATYAEALRVLQDAKTQIAAAHHDDELVKRLGTQALFAARHAQQINDRVSELQAQFKGTASASPSVALGVGAGAALATRVNAQVGGNVPVIEKASVEKIALQEEERLRTISSSLGQKDLRDLPLDKQVQEIKRAATDITVQAKNEAGIATIKDLEARLQAANDATAKAMTQLADKDKQLSDQNLQLADKDAQITKLNEHIANLENAARKGKRK